MNESDESKNSSILSTIKKMLGIENDYNVFDTEIVAFINSAVLALTQIGIGRNGFHLTGESETWGDFLGDGFDSINDSVAYVYYKVRLAFDPPSSSVAVDSMKELMKELEWRLSVESETPSESIG